MVVAETMKLGWAAVSRGVNRGHDEQATDVLNPFGMIDPIEILVRDEVGEIVWES